MTLDPWHFPLLNTLILLTSGTTVTWAHHAIQTGDRKGAVQGLILTVLLGASVHLRAGLRICPRAVHLRLQSSGAGAVHRCRRMQSLAAGVGNFDAIYGSTFFMATGFHGFHVIIGTIFLTVCLVRAIAGQFTPTRHFGFEAAAWYWHFVDVVWLFLFACIYVWGQGPCVGCLSDSRSVRAACSASVRAAGRGRCSTAISRSSRSARACGLDYAMFDAGDGPAVFVILIVGAIVGGAAL